MLLFGLMGEKMVGSNAQKALKILVKMSNSMEDIKLNIQNNNVLRIDAPIILYKLKSILIGFH